MTRSANDRSPEDWRVPLLQAALAHIPFDGVTWRAFARAAQELDLPKKMAELAFPGGMDEAVDLYCQEADRKMTEAMTPYKLANMKIRQKVSWAVQLRLQGAAEHREAASRVAGYLMQRPALSARILWRTADTIWRAIGDTSTDYNWYTKRAILSGVYSSTLLVWLSDPDPQMARTRAFLDRRIENVMQFEKAKGRVMKAGEAMPSLSRFLGRLRYPAAR